MIQIFENKGDLYICIKDAPKGTKEMLEKAFADTIVKELKGLVKEPEKAPDVDGFIPADNDEVPFVEDNKQSVNVSKAKETSEEEYANDNIPFQKPERTSKPAAQSNYDPFA